VAAGQLPEHLLEEIVEVLAAGDALEVGGVSLFRRGEVEAVGAGVVEEIALEAPDLVIHLPPFDERLDEDLHLPGVQGALPGLDRAGRRGDRPLRPLVDEDLLARGRKDKVADAVQVLVGLPGAQVELMEVLDDEPPSMAVKAWGASSRKTRPSLAAANRM